MLQLVEPPPVKRIAAVLASSGVPRAEIVRELERHWGITDFVSDPIEFTFTDYYTDEMGRDLFRFFVSFARLMPAESLVRAKHEANAVEASFLSGTGQRRVNVDVGYLDLRRVVLASTKEGRQKIYLGGGIWADLILLYHKGGWEALPWTFPDFRSGTYDPVLLHIRDLYKQDLRRWRVSGACSSQADGDR